MGTLAPDAIRANLRAERAAAYVYARLVAAERGKAGALFADLVAESEKQAERWTDAEERRSGLPDSSDGGRERSPRTPAIAEPSLPTVPVTVESVSSQ